MSNCRSSCSSFFVNVLYAIQILSACQSVFQYLFQVFEKNFLINIYIYMLELSWCLFQPSSLPAPASPLIFHIFDKRDRFADSCHRCTVCIYNCTKSLYLKRGCCMIVLCSLISPVPYRSTTFRVSYRHPLFVFYQKNSSSLLNLNSLKSVKISFMQRVILSC